MNTRSPTRLPLRTIFLFSLLAVAAALFAGGEATTVTAGPGGPIAPTHFKQNSVYRYCNTTFPASGLPTMCAEGPPSETLAPGAPYDQTVSFNLPWGHLNFSSTVVFAPTASGITPGSQVPLGAIVGKLRSSTTLGLLNAPCSPLGNETGTLEINFAFMNATTQTNLVLEPFTLANASGEGTAEVYRDDIDGNGLPDHVDKYPAYLNKVFDPDRNGDANGDGDEFDSILESGAEAALGIDLNGNGVSTDAADLNGDGDTGDTVAENPGASISDPFGTIEPLVPLVRQSANTNVVGTAVALEFLTFEPGTLEAFDPPHPYSDLTAELGYPTVVILTDPNQPLSPSSITDFCTPLATFTINWGVSRDNPCTPNRASATAPVRPNDGFGCFNQNDMCATACGNNNFINEAITVCTNEADDDGDGAANDGCPASGPGEVACNDNTGFGGADSDNDADNLVDDGCPASGTSELTCVGCVDGLKTTGGEGGVTRNTLPASGTGLHGSDTHLIYATAASLRDADADGYENNLDTCKEDVNIDGDPRVTNTGAPPNTDADMIDTVCDPLPTINNNGFNQDGDQQGFPAGSWSNGQDNCPVFPNDTQRQIDNNLPRQRTTPFGGPAGDDIGDACEGAETGADCASGNIADEDGDTAVNDGCPPRGGGNGAGDAEPINGGGLTACANATNEDGPGVGTNDSTDPNGAAPDNFINDGCPTRSITQQFVIANGHFHTHYEVQAKCISSVANPDDDRDGYCDTLETSLASTGTNAGNPGNQTGCESNHCGQDLPGLTGPGGKELGAQCGTNAVDNDQDGYVNEGCPAVVSREADVIGDTQCQDADDDDADTAINDGCFTAGRGNCQDGVDNDGDTFMDLADAGCETPEDRAIDAPATLLNIGAGPDADNDGIVDHDEGEASPNDDAVTTADGQQEEPHGICADDIDQDDDASRDANATTSGGAADGVGTDSGCLDLASDGDRDSLIDASDNCDAAFNPSQRDTNSDAEGDACDTNDDGDAALDTAEYACGSRSLVSASVCEVGGNGIDDDQDGATDESAVPVALNPTVSAAAGPLGDRWMNHDRDGDGWTLSQERLLGTAPTGGVNALDTDPCGGVGSGSDGWGSDLASANNAVNIGDINSFLTPARTGDNIDGHGSFNMFNHVLDDDGDTTIETAENPDSNGGLNDPPTYNVGRWNLQLPPHVAGTAINIGDLNSLITGALGSPARPPMFGGGAAFFTNSGSCPFLP